MDKSKTRAGIAGPSVSEHVNSKRLGKQLSDLYAIHAPAVVRLAYLLTGEEEAARDICQEAFVRVGGRLGGLRDPEKVPAYLFRTVVNLSRGHGRALKRERRLLEKLPRFNTQAAPDTGRHDELMHALITLPPRQRAAIFLRYYLDLPEVQAAEVLNSSMSALKSLVHRALKTLRDELKEDTE
ncbi:MAG: sigma-70 family RNA polymerase sigma factor [Actinobacteria bacterium]|nr:sigma-70 family RNA polymerase sigma factor [Actinomycetota bacterium]